MYFKVLCPKECTVGKDFTILFLRVRVVRAAVLQRGHHHRPLQVSELQLGALMSSRYSSREL